MSPELEIRGVEIMTLVEANIVPRYCEYHVLKKGVLAWSKSRFTIMCNILPLYIMDNYYPL